MEKNKIEQLAIETIQQHENKYKELKDRWNELIALYENKLEADSISADTESKVALGGAFSLVENALPRLLGRDPRYQYLGREADDGKAVEVYDEFAQYQWELAQVNQKLRKITRWGLATGLAGWEMNWKEERVYVKGKAMEVFGKRITNPAMISVAEKLKLGKKVKVDEERTSSNYEIIPIRPHDLIWSPDAEEVEDAAVLGHRATKKIKELEALGYDVKELRRVVSESDKVQEQLEKQDNITAAYKTAIVDEFKVNVAKLYITVVESNIYRRYLTLIAYGEGVEHKTIYLEPNQLDEQFVPMGIFRPVDRLGKFYGFGVIEPARGTLRAEEDNFNMALEALWTDIARPAEYDPSKILDMEALQYRNRTLIPVRGIGQAFNVLPTPSPRMDSVSIVADYLTRAKQNITGITDFQTGSDQLSGAKTLGEIQIKTRESNLRLSDILKALERQTIEPIGRMSLWFNKQFLADQKEIIYRVVGRKGQYLEKKAKFKDIEAIKDVIVVSGSSADVIQQAELQKWSLLLQQAYMEERSTNPVPINKEPIWEKLLENGLLVKDVESYIPSLAEREEETVKGKVAQMDDAKRENANPSTARVLPTDITEVHVPLHKAEVEARQRELDQMEAQGGADPRLMEELQLLVQHLNEHQQQAGGPASQAGGGRMSTPPLIEKMQPEQGASLPRNYNGPQV